MFIAFRYFFNFRVTAKFFVGCHEVNPSRGRPTINISCLRHLLLSTGHHQSNFFVAGNLWIDFADDPAVMNDQQAIR